MSRKKDTAPTYGCCRGWGRYPFCGCGGRGGRRQRGAAELRLVDELYDEFVARLVKV